MYIQPNTNLRLIKNSPIDSDYTNTLSFPNIGTQTAYFTSLVKYSLTNNTYQRVNKNTCRVSINCDLLYDVNYLMFQNSAYGNKWFYAFVTSVNYINDNCTEVVYEIDVLQTWYFDYDFNVCFVEREHSSTDEIGDNIMPEPVELGEYIFNGYTDISVTGLNDFCIIIAIVDTTSQQTFGKGNVYDGVYGAASLYAYTADSTGTTMINGWILEYIDKPDAIISIYMCPKALISSAYINTNNKLPFASVGDSFYVSLNTLPFDLPSSPILDGYRVKNNKLMTYPYNFLHIDNGTDSSLSLRYEFFNTAGHTPTLSIIGNLTQPVNIVLRPSNYKYTTGGQPINTEELTLSNYPLCSWTVDSYQAWVAQNTVPMTYHAMGVGVSAISKLATGKKDLKASAGEDILSEMINIASQQYTASIQADMMKGSYGNGNVRLAHGLQTFFGGRCSITRQYAETIDNFFSMYGYATNKLKKPNRTSRAIWNYVKTVGCTINGTIPCDDEKKICAIHNKGVTYWHNGLWVGNYSLDNKIV